MKGDNCETVNKLGEKMDQLPDNLILTIFSFLPVKDRCVVGRVCKRFRRITCDNSLWRDVDLLPYRLNVRKTWKVIRSHLSECLLTFKIRGFLGKTGKKSKEVAVTNAVLEDLCDRCPNLRYFHLHSVNIDSVDASKLPKSISKLVIQECTWPVGWLRNATLPNLRVLDVTDTRIMDASRVDDIIKFVTLEEVCLDFCYRINDKAVKSLAENLPRLKSLSLSETSLTNLGLHHLCRALPDLVELNLDHTAIEDGSVETVASGLKQLQELSLWDCRKLSQDCYRPLRNMKKLKKLIVNETILPAVYDEIKTALPHCKIIKKERIKKGSYLQSNS